MILDTFRLFAKISISLSLTKLQQKKLSLLFQERSLNGHPISA